MKAKEIAANVAAAADPLNALWDAQASIIEDAVVKARARQSLQSQVAVLREAFQKWVSVVRAVAESQPKVAAAPEKIIGWFPKCIFAVAPTMYVACCTYRAFLSYDLDEEDKAALQKKSKELVQQNRQQETADVLSWIRDQMA